MQMSRGTIRRMDGDELLTIRRAAAEIGVSHMTIRRWLDAGHLTAIRPGTEYLLTRRQVERMRDPKNRPQPGRPRKAD